MMNKLNFKFSFLFLLFLILFFSSTLNATTVISPMAMYNQLNNCHSLTDALVYEKDKFRITLATEPHGYCKLSVKTAGITEPINCYLSADDVAAMTSTGAKNVFYQAQTGGINNINPADVLTYFAPLVTCFGELLPISS